jgi:hypothetical protein
LVLGISRSSIGISLIDFAYSAPAALSPPFCRRGSVPHGGNMMSRQLARWLIALSVVPTLFSSSALAQGFRLRTGDAAAFMVPEDSSEDRPLQPAVTSAKLTHEQFATNGAPPPADAAAPADAAEPPVDNWFHQGNLRFQIGGQYRVEPNFSNFFFQPVTLGNDPPSENFAAQRLRVWLTAMPNDHIEGYVQMQVGGFLWGQNFEFPKTFKGPLHAPLGIIAPDNRIGIMLRRAWLGYNDDDCGKFRIGILDWHDSFGDTLASSDYEFDVAGVDWTKTWEELGKLKVIVGAFILTDEATLFDSTDIPGHHDAYLFTFDVDKPVGDSWSIGGSIYYIVDDGEYSYPTNLPYRSSWDLWFGLRARYNSKQMPLNAFVIFNPGERDDFTGPTFQHHGWAAKLEAGPIPFGPGKFSAQVLWASGESNPNDNNSSEFRTVAQTYQDNFGAQGYWSYLYITSPNGPSDVKDLGVSLQDRGLGLFTMQAKYEYPICHRLSASTAAGWLWSAASNPTSASKQIGPELAQQFTYDFGYGLKADIGAAVLFTGDFYKAAPGLPRPDDLWMVFSRVQLEF